VLNIAQLIGWGTFELITIAGAAAEVFSEGPAWLHAPRWLFVIAAGLLTTLLTIWPLGSVRLLRRFVTVAVVISLGYFYVQFLRQGLPDLGQGSWNKFWVGADAALAVSISWVPVAADYTRHSRSTKAAFGAASVAYSVTQIVAYVLGLFALALATTDNLYTPFLHVALGAVFLGVFVLREVDQSFANVYSTAVSIQNLFPRWDRRILTIVLGGAITGAALLLKDMNSYFGFLGLIGSVFVPMLGVLVADFFLLGRGRDWNLSRSAPSRWGMIAAWVIGFAVYQLIRPSDIGWWNTGWIKIAGWLHFTPADWMSASLLSFAIAVLAAFAIGRAARRQGDR
jgi:purine-cytosine permease-like protein